MKQETFTAMHTRHRAIGAVIGLLVAGIVFAIGFIILGHLLASQDPDAPWVLYARPLWGGFCGFLASVIASKVAAALTSARAIKRIAQSPSQAKPDGQK